MLRSGWYSGVAEVGDGQALGDSEPSTRPCASLSEATPRTEHSSSLADRGGLILYWR